VKYTEMGYDRVFLIGVIPTCLYKLLKIKISQTHQFIVNM